MSSSRFGLDFDDASVPEDGTQEPAPQSLPTIDDEGGDEVVSPDELVEQTRSHMAQARAEDERYAALSPEERTREIFQKMESSRKELLAILNACRTRQRFEALDAIVAEIQKSHASVFSAASYCDVLCRAGALEKVTEDGQHYPEGEAEPLVVDEENGTQHLETPEPPTPYWQTTEVGTAYADADDPYERAMGLIQDDARYTVIYHRVLDLTAQDGGATTKALGDAVDKDPLVQKPRYFAMHFTERLERCDALEWNGAAGRWVITKTGRALLESLSSADGTAAVDFAQED